MYLERDAKILLIYYSIYGIISLVALYLIFLSFQLKSPNENFSFIQIMIFTIICILTLIIVVSSYSLKKEISGQQEYLLNLQKTTSSPSIIKVPYNKSGLYSIIIASVLGLIGVLYMYTVLMFQHPSNSNISFQKGTLETVSLMFFLMIIFLIVILAITLRILMKRIQTPIYYEYKPCPRCNSSEIFKVEYSWWGGLLGPVLVHQVRCKKCGLTYDGSSGRNIKQPVTLYFIISLTIIVILIALRYLLH